MPEIAVERGRPDAKLLTPSNRAYEPFGSAVTVFYAQDAEILYGGPAGTGKSRAALEKMNLCAMKYPGMRGLMVRKAKESLTQSARVTFEKFVMPDDGSVRWRTTEQEYRYSNGSVIVVGGMDKFSRVMSSEYDLIYIQEATELDEDDWEALITRCRFGMMPYNQILADCNPASPYHWLKKRCDDRRTRYVRSFHEDNPVLFDHETNDWTPRGRAYMSKLDNLTGVRKKRLRHGIWAAAEGQIYDEWDAAVHYINHFNPPRGWRRVWTVDFGYVNPFVFQAWAIDDNDRAFLFYEIYQTKTLVEDIAGIVRRWRETNKEPEPIAVLCDHDAEDRATLERHLEIATTPADKSVQSGIQSVKTCLKNPETGDASVFIMRDTLHAVDEDLEDAGKPTRTAEEIEGYEWDDKKIKEQPIKIDDHGMDALRYFCNFKLNIRRNWSKGMAR